MSTLTYLYRIQGWSLCCDRENEGTVLSLAPPAPLCWLAVRRVSGVTCDLWAVPRFKPDSNRASTS